MVGFEKSPNKKETSKKPETSSGVMGHQSGSGYGEGSGSGDGCG